MAKESKGLGKGLAALFGETEEAYLHAQSGEGASTEIELERIYPNPDQPRKAFDETAMKDLANSIREHGVIMPLVVNRDDDGKFMIIAGERRYRAAIMAGLTSVPVIIKELDEREVQEISLIENLQREDLNPIEAAYGMKKLMDEYDLTQEALAERLGKSRPAIANTLRLLSLAEKVISLVREGKLSAGHARTLVPVAKDEQGEIAEECLKNGWSVRELERAVKAKLNPPEVLAKEKEKKNAATSAELKYMVERLREAFKTKVSLIGTDKKGRIYIDYYTRDDLDRICELLEIIENQK